MGTLVLAGATSGSATLTPVDAATAVITLPSATATLATLGANTFVGNQAITGTLSVSGAITEIPRMAVYQWTTWNPSDVAGSSTNAPSTAVATSTATSYATMANASGTLTFTFVKAGVYNINMAGGLATILAGITRATFNFTLGGTATRLISTSPRANQNHDEAFDFAFNFAVVATANQTLTILPSSTLSGAGVAANFTFYASASAAYMGT
jgi:hypothetical protein